MGERMSGFLERVGDALPQFLAEYRQAFELLDTRSHAQHVQPFRFISAEHSFAVRRFALARERLIAQGAAAYLATLRNPAQIATTDTGPELTSYDAMAYRTPWIIAELIQRLGTQTGQLRAGENHVSSSAELPGMFCEPDLQFDWDRDPEEPAFDLSCDVASVPNYLDLTWPEETTMELDWAERFNLQAGERRPILDSASDHITYSAGAVLAEALRSERLLPSRVKHAKPEVVLRMGTSWRALHRTGEQGSIQVDLPALLAMPTTQRQATLAGIIGHALVGLVPEQAAEHADLELQRDSWLAEAPDVVLVELGLRTL